MIAVLTSLVATAETAPSLNEGRYLMTLHAATQARVPVFGWTPSVTTSQVVVELSRTETGWVQRHEVCDVRVSGHAKRGRTEIPDAFVEALPVKRYAVKLTPSGEGWRYDADLGIDHLGYDPSLTAEVPRKPGDVGVIDGDSDGFPGVTVRLRVPLVGSADVYVVQRASMKLAGEVSSDGTVEGRIEVDDLYQRTLSASHWMFKGSPEIRPIPEDSWFSMRPAPNARCADLRGG
ncbi:MAG: hypothetical protein AAGA48_16050 [Myxococcota bacterium]